MDGRNKWMTWGPNLRFPANAGLPYSASEREVQDSACSPPQVGKSWGSGARDTPLSAALADGSLSPVQPEGWKVTPHCPPLPSSVLWIYKHTQ